MGATINTSRADAETRATGQHHSPYNHHTSMDRNFDAPPPLVADEIIPDGMGGVYTQAPTTARDVRKRQRTAASYDSGKLDAPMRFLFDAELQPEPSTSGIVNGSAGSYASCDSGSWSPGSEGANVLPGNDASPDQLSAGFQGASTSASAAVDIPDLDLSVDYEWWAAFFASFDTAPPSDPTLNSSAVMGELPLVSAEDSQAILYFGPEGAGQVGYNFAPVDQTSGKSVLLQSRGWYLSSAPDRDIGAR